jgi:transposase, IS5 family
MLAAQLEQTANLMQDLGRAPKRAIVDLAYRGVDGDNPGVEIIQLGKYKSLTKLKRKWLERRHAIEPLIGHTKADHSIQRCWLKGALGDALPALSCAAGYIIRLLLRAIAAKAAKDAKAFFFALSKLALWGRTGDTGPLNALKLMLASALEGWLRLVGTEIDRAASLGSARASRIEFCRAD